jgi:hypothetical protein
MGYGSDVIEAVGCAWQMLELVAQSVSSGFGVRACKECFIWFSSCFLNTEHDICHEPIIDKVSATSHVPNFQLQASKRENLFGNTFLRFQHCPWQSILSYGFSYFVGLKWYGSVQLSREPSTSG